MSRSPVIAAIVFAGSWLACPSAFAAPAAVLQKPEAAAGRSSALEAAYDALNGPWVGALEYRDYSSNQRVFLPTILHIRRTKDGKSLTLHYIYDDGPTKVVEDFETVTIDPAAGTYVIVSGDGKDVTTDTLTGLKELGKSGQGQLIRSGKGEEDNKPVDVRTTVTLSPHTLTILKETRLTGQPFLFRDQYTLTRIGRAATGQ